MRSKAVRPPNGQDKLVVRLSPSPSGSIAWAISMLKDQGMPSEEIATILRTDDPVLVSRYVELHRERLEEHFAAQRRTLARLERMLTERSLAITARSRRRGRRDQRARHRDIGFATIGPDGPERLEADPGQNQPTDQPYGIGNCYPAGNLIRIRELR
jgi:hypothetical protein